MRIHTLTVALFALCSFVTWNAPANATADNDDRSSPPVYYSGKASTAKIVKGRAAAAYAYAPAYTSSALVNQARRYIGTNPTNRRSLWCGAFMDLVLKQTGHKAGSNLASSYASYGRRVAGPIVGAIAVMSRGKGGGHVGVVSGIDEKGNVIVVSGNHGNTVAEAAYPRGRIYAYVMPD